MSLSVNRTILAKDPLNHGSEAQYFAVGESALTAAQKALRTAGRTESDIASIMDFGCGYGRVARWLRAAWPKADLLCVDNNPEAVAACGELLGVRTRAGDPAMAAPLGGPFDLIWAGSTLPHKPKAGAAAALAYLARHLSSRGVLVITAHGPYVAQRIRTKEKTYGLKDEQAARLLKGYDLEGYGYGDFPNRNDYGISAAGYGAVTGAAAGAGLKPVFHEEKLWAAHQDVYAFVKA